MSTITMNLFRKNTKLENGATISNYFLKFKNDNVCVSCKLTNEAKFKMAKIGVEFPLEIDLEDNKDYFITQEKYENKDGIICFKDVVVIQNWSGLRHLELSSPTLNDILAKHKEN